jgi:hypothetical protein
MVVAPQMQKSRSQTTPALLVLRLWFCPIWRRSDVRIIAADYVAAPVIDGRAMSPRPASCEHCDQRKHGSDRTYDHQDHPDIVDVEPMLIRSDCDRKVENCTDSKGDNACY